MPQWTCDFSGCDRTSVRHLGDCELCDRHLCSLHLRPEFHTCPSFYDDAFGPLEEEAVQREIERLIKRIDTGALETRASRLRQGRKCSIPALRYDRATRRSVTGFANFHFDVRFDDGVTWIARVRRGNVHAPPAPLRNLLVQNEVATLRFLERTNVPAPRVHDFELESAATAVGVSFILMDKVPGRSLSWSDATQHQKEKVLSQLADIFVELHRYSFGLVGCLDGWEETRVGPVALECFTNVEGSQLRTTGPFESLAEYCRSFIRVTLDLIVRDEKYLQRAADVYLIQRFLLDLIPHILPQPKEGDEMFYLKHVDDKGDHIFIDEDYNITGIIDWEKACTAPASVAFGSPRMLLPLDDFYDGINDPSEDETVFVRLFREKGRPDLADCILKDRLLHRFDYCCGYNHRDWEGYKGLFRGLRDIAGVDGGLDWDEWAPHALERYKDDVGLQKVLARQAESDKL